MTFFINKKNKLKKEALRSINNIDIIIINILFLFKDLFIQYKNNYINKEYLYIPKLIEQNIFELVYNKRNYIGFYRIYKNIVDNYYIRYLTRRFKYYILYYL